MNETKTLFDNSKKYKTDMSSKLTYGDIPKSVLFEIFKDGRVAGLINESLVASLFKNIAKTLVEGAAFDVYDKKWGTTYEVRSVTKGGTKTCPSAMVGVGRKYNADNHLEKMVNIDYFLFVDVRSFPVLYFYPLKADTPELLVKNITAKNFDKMIEKLFVDVSFETIEL